MRELTKTGKHSESLSGEESSYRFGEFSDDKHHFRFCSIYPSEGRKYQFSISLG